MVSSSSIRISLSPFSLLIEHSSGHPASELFISSTTIGELYYGVLNSNKIDANTKRLVDFIRDTVSVPCDDDTARHLAVPISNGSLKSLWAVELELSALFFVFPEMVGRRTMDAEAQV